MKEQQLNVTTPRSKSAAAVAEPMKKYELDGKDRALLPLSLLLGVLMVELFITCFQHVGGLIVPMVVAVWYGIFFWYRGFQGLKSRAGGLLFVSVCLLALTFALWSNPWFRLWNLLALPCLMGVQLFEIAGADGERKPWWSISMLWERCVLTLKGLFCNLGAPFQAAASLNQSKRTVYVLAGLAASVLLLLMVVPMLLSADALFRHITNGFLGFLEKNLAPLGGRLLAGLCIAPLLYGLLYALRRPRPHEKTPVQGKTFVLDVAAPVTMLVVMNALYFFFILVQFAALFGGEKYLAQVDISYATYARSGFFQLVGVALLNLALVMACLHFSGKEGRGWQLVQILCTTLVAVSCLMLISAAYRMTIYVGVYGLSFKRFLTYWGMGMLCIFFAAAVLKIWRKQFSFFKVVFVAGLAGWLFLNYINVDGLVARYNVALYTRDPGAVDLAYLVYSSYDTLHVLETLPDDTMVAGVPLNLRIAAQRASAAADASNWRTWSVSAQRAAHEKVE